MRRWLKVVVVAAIFAIVWVVAAPLLANFLIVEKPLDHADAILVLSGSAVYKERTQKAAELFAQGVAPKIFITNDGERAGWSDAEKTNPAFVELERRSLIENGVPADAITVLPGEVSGTDTEAKELAAEIDRTPISSVLLVTSPYHTQRALRTFQKVLGGKEVNLGIEHADRNEKTPGAWTWWFSVIGWKTVGAEIGKSAAYYVIY